MAIQAEGKLVEKEKKIIYKRQFGEQGWLSK